MFPIYSIKVENQASKSPVHLPPPDADTAECEKAAPDDTEHRNQKEGDKDTLVPIRATMFPNKHASTICSASLILFLGAMVMEIFSFFVPTLHPPFCRVPVIKNKQTFTQPRNRL